MQKIQQDVDTATGQENRDIYRFQAIKNLLDHQAHQQGNEADKQPYEKIS